jgi:hypothetical protein
MTISELIETLETALDVDGDLEVDININGKGLKITDVLEGIFIMEND